MAVGFGPIGGGPIGFPPQFGGAGSGSSSMPPAASAGLATWASGRLLGFATASALVLLTSGAEAAAPLRPEPVAMPQAARQAPVRHDPANLLLTTLARPVGQIATETPPRGPSYGRAPVVAPSLLQTTLAPAAPAATPLLPLAWPLPPQPKQEPITSRWFCYYYVVDDSSPFQSSADPLPRVARPTQPPTWTGNLLESTLVAAPVRPVGAAVSGVPEGRAFPVVLRTATDGRKPYHVDERLVGQAHTTLPAPRRPAPPVLDVGPVLTTTLAIPPGIPVRPIEWVIPQGRPYPVVLRTATDGRKPYHQDLRPAPTASWPLPARPVPMVPLFWSAWAVPETAAPAGTPFVPRSWPLPASRPVRTETWTSASALVTTLARPVGQAAIAWPAPRQVMAVGATASRLDLLNVRPVGTAATDVPAPARWPVSQLTIAGWRALHLVDETPAHLTEWPLPLVQTGRLSVAFAQFANVPLLTTPTAAPTERMICVVYENRVVAIPVESREAAVPQDPTCGGS